MYLNSENTYVAVNRVKMWFFFSDGSSIFFYYRAIVIGSWVYMIKVLKVPDGLNISIVIR